MRGRCSPITSPSSCGARTYGRRARARAVAPTGRSATARSSRARRVWRRLIEFSHRATSGLALLAVAALVVATFRTCRAGHPARAGAVMSGVLILSEAAIGAGLVLFQLVADNATMARAMFVAAHLLNTFLLLGALTLTAWWLTVGLPFAAKRRGMAPLITGCVALLVAGASGAVAALGDTLFPAQSLAESLARRSLVHVAPPDPAPHLPPGARRRCCRCRRRLCRTPRAIRAGAQPARRAPRRRDRARARLRSASSTSSCSPRCGCSSRTCSSRMRCGSASCWSAPTP